MARRISLLAAVLVLHSIGCATYTDRIETATRQASVGDYSGAVEQFDAVLGVDSPDELPDSWGSERPLAVLERGVLQQALENYTGSTRDLSAGEAELELLDYQSDPVGTVGSYIYSDSAGDYRFLPTERLALNGVNMMNYLAVADWSGSAVEARRFTVNRQYLESIDLTQQCLFGAYLAGLTFERLGEGDRALRYYEEAMAGGVLPTLREPVLRLAGANPYRGPKIRELIGDRATPYVKTPSEVVTVLSLGRVPHKVPERMPVGAAIGVAGVFITGNTDILARSAFKVVVFPELKASGSLARDAVVEIDGQRAPVDRVSSIGSDIHKEYDRLKPRIIAAALSRMIARAAAAEGARYAGRQAGGSAGAVIGLLAALGTEAALVGLDKPDTRSWTMLADYVLVSRQVVEPGSHRLRAVVTGASLRVERELELEVPPGQAVVVVLTVPR